MPTDANRDNPIHAARATAAGDDPRQQLDRRSFLSLLASASVAPALPLSGKVAAAAAGSAYNRYSYGYAVFRIRHGGAIGAADLAASLKIPLAQANGMIAQMTKDGLVRSTGAGAVRAVSTHGGRIGHSSYIRKAARLAAQALDQIDAPEQDIADQTQVTEIRTDGIPTRYRRDTDMPKPLRPGS